MSISNIFYAIISYFCLFLQRQIQFLKRKNTIKEIQNAKRSSRI